MSSEDPPCPLHRGLHRCPPATCDRVRALKRKVVRLKERVAELEAGEEEVRFQLAHFSDCIAWLSNNAQMKDPAASRP